MKLTTKRKEQISSVLIICLGNILNAFSARVFLLPAGLVSAVSSRVLSSARLPWTFHGLLRFPTSILTQLPNSDLLCKVRPPTSGKEQAVVGSLSLQL